MANIPKGTTFNGEVCAKHPKLKGLRYLQNRACVECSAQRAKTNWAKSREKMVTMENLLTEWSSNGGPADLMARTAEVLELREKTCEGCGRICSFTAHFCRGCGRMI